MIDKLFAILWRSEVKLETRPHINIGFVKDALDETFKKENGHDAVKVLKHLLIMLETELVPIKIMQKVQSLNCKASDIRTFTHRGIGNRLFSFTTFK